MKDALKEAAKRASGNVLPDSTPTIIMKDTFAIQISKISKFRIDNGFKT